MSSNAAVPVTVNPVQAGHDKRLPRVGSAPGTLRSFSAAEALLDAYLASRKRLAAPQPQPQSSTPQHSPPMQPYSQPQTGGQARVQTEGQSAQSRDGQRSVVLLFRRHYRVSLSEHADGQILISARIVSLPETGPRRDAMLTHIGRLGLGFATRYGAACVADATEQDVWLQDRQAPDGKPVDLAIRVRAFVNALATWQKTLDRIHF